MLENNRSIGGSGLEQGGPNLGNDISRGDMSIKNAGDALTTPNTSGAGSNNKNTEDADLTEDDELEEDDDLLLDDDELDEDDDDDELEEDKTL